MLMYAKFPNIFEYPGSVDSPWPVLGWGEQILGPHSFILDLNTVPVISG